MFLGLNTGVQELPFIIFVTPCRPGAHSAIWSRAASRSLFVEGLT
jgi:hypothetical protein